MDKITKIILVASIAVIAVLAVLVFGRGGEEELFPENKVERPAGRKPVSGIKATGKSSAAMDFVASNEETKKIMAGIVEALKSGDEDRIADAIIEMEHIGTEDMLALAPVAMRIADPEYRKDIIARFERMPHRGAIAVLADAASRDSDPAVRAAAISALAMTDEALAIEREKAAANGEDTDRLTPDERDMEIAEEAIRSAVNDKDKDVRKEAMDSLPRFSADLQYSGLMSAVKAEDKDVREDALFIVHSSYNKETVAVVMKALDDRDESIRENARDFLNHMLDQEFTSTKEAEAWWEQNSHKYDYDLVEE